jgi:glycosyltransferase involved in cell wall biosynthesis
MNPNVLTLTPGIRETQHRPAVSAVIPCLNEERTIAICITKAQGSFRRMGIDGEVVVADNGSTDRSAEIARGLGARVVFEPRKGYGAALHRGITESRGKVVVMGDADDSYDWGAIEPFVQKIAEGYDLVMGNRFTGEIKPGAMPPLHRYLGNPVLSAVARAAFDVTVGDFHCGMRAFTREAYPRMRTQSTGMEFATEMVAGAAHQGLRIGEIPIVLHKDKRERPPHLRTFRDGWRHLRFILTFAPDHVYFVPGIAMLVAGLALLATLVGGSADVGGVHMGIHYVALGSMLALIGFNVINLGVLAKAMLAQRYTGLRSRVVAWVRHRFSLEAGLIVGALLVVLGFGTDAYILGEWLASGQGPMEDTTHLAFVATTSAVLGMNVVFSSLLLALMTRTDGSGT